MGFYQQDVARNDRTCVALAGVRALLIAAIALCPSAAAAQALALPVEVALAALPNFGSELVYTIDLGTLPTRPALVVEVFPDAAHSDMLLEIEINGFTGDLGGPGINCNMPATSAPVPGTISLEFDFTECDPRPNAFAGATLDVLIRPLAFGATGAPANVQVVIRGETRVPTGSLFSAVDTNVDPQQYFAHPSKDTVIYASDHGANNGAGLSLWAGKDYSVSLPAGIRRDPMRALIAFDFVGVLPFNAQIENAELEVYVQEFLGTGGNLSVLQVAAPADGLSWREGTAIGPGSGFTGASNNISAADWLTRNGSSALWLTPGGDLLGGALNTISVARTGYHRLRGLEPAIQNMVDTQRGADGFMLVGPFDFLTLGDEGIRIASREAIPLFAPLLIIDYAAAGPWSEGTVTTGAKSFITEGEDFRWIYDVSPTDPVADDVYLTPIGGVCTITDPNPTTYTTIPYSYSFTGAPGYTGLDCCTWQIDSSQTQTVGTGQLLFFHNLDPFDAANLPPDSDGDGIFDLCDNCPNTPNGPQLGSCRGGPTPGAPCHNEAECGVAGSCDLSQLDADADLEGDLCEVPEPAGAAGLLAGIGCLALLARGREPGLASARADTGRSPT